MHLDTKENAELEAILIENQRKLVETAKLRAEAHKLQVEARKLSRESWLYPIFVAAAVVTAYATFMHHG